MSSVFKAVAAKADDISAVVIPFDVKKEHLTLTIDSNLVYFADAHEYHNESAPAELAVWSLGGVRKTITQRFDSSEHV